MEYFVNANEILSAVVAKLHQTIDASYTGINETMYAQKLLDMIEGMENDAVEKLFALFDSAKIK